MPDIVIPEFMDAAPVERLRAKYSVHWEEDLWSKRAELEALMADAVALIVRNRTQVDAGLIGKAPKLRVVGRLGVGLDNIDLEACKARGIAVCPATGANADAVGEYVVAAALAPLAPCRILRLRAPDAGRMAPPGDGRRLRMRRAGRWDWSASVQSVR